MFEIDLELSREISRFIDEQDSVFDANRASMNVRLLLECYSLL